MLKLEHPTIQGGRDTLPCGKWERSCNPRPEVASNPSRQQDHDEDCGHSHNWTRSDIHMMPTQSVEGND